MCSRTPHLITGRTCPMCLEKTDIIKIKFLAVSLIKKSRNHSGFTNERCFVIFFIMLNSHLLFQINSKTLKILVCKVVFTVNIWNQQINTLLYFNVITLLDIFPVGSHA